MKSFALSVCLAAGLSLVMASDPYSTELAMLQRAIQSSAARLTIIDGKVGAIETAASQLSSTLNTISSTMISAAQTTNTAQDSTISSAFSSVNSQLSDVTRLTADVSKAESLAHDTIALQQDYEKRIVDQEALSLKYKAQIEGLDTASDQLDNKVDENVDAKNLISEAEMDAAFLRINGTINLFDTKRCIISNANVNVSTGQGTVTLAYASDFFDTFGSVAIPNLYCAITAVQSEINEKQSQVYGYGYHPSDREESGFDVSCVINSGNSNQVDVIVTDSSQSERGLDKTIEVSVAVKICTFTAQGDFDI